MAWVTVFGAPAVTLGHGGTRRRPLARLRDQIVLGGEVSVKAAVRQLRRLHDVGDADAVKPLLGKQGTRPIDDAFTVLGGLLPAHSHGTPQLCVRTATLDKLYDNRHQYTSNMMIVI
jgi:hypothetical protein